jgi:hypothetical protein
VRSSNSIEYGRRSTWPRSHGQNDKLRLRSTGVGARMSGVPAQYRPGSNTHVDGIPVVRRGKQDRAVSSVVTFTDYHAKFVACELTRWPGDSVERLAAALVDAQVDLNPHQVDAALFAFKSPLSKGALLADAGALLGGCRRLRGQGEQGLLRAEVERVYLLVTGACRRLPCFTVRQEQHVEILSGGDFIPRSGPVTFTRIHVSDRECERGYGTLRGTPLDGRPQTRSEFIIGGDNVASDIAEVLCAKSRFTTNAEGTQLS